MDVEIEIFKDIPDYQGLYKVGSFGSVICFRKSKIRYLALRLSSKGYLRTTLHLNGKRKTKQIHQLVAIVFLDHIPCGSDLVVNHKDFDKSNNRKDNLEIITTRENSNQLHIESYSKFVGIDFHKKTMRWRAMITNNKKLLHLGLFLNELDACLAYKNKLSEINKTK